MGPGPEHAAAGAPWRHVAYGEIDSTNAEAMRRAGAGERGPLWITADVQTRGRGRSGRSWVSAEGSVAATLLLAPGCPIARLPELALVAGVAAHDAIAGAMPGEDLGRLRLKWPNDVLIDGAKVCGILIESMSLGPEAVAAIGIGINVLAVPRVEGRDVAALAAKGSVASVEKVATRLAARLAAWLDVWQAGRGFGRVRTGWLERAGPLGEPININAGEGPIAGAFAGLDSDGALLLDDGSATRRRFAFGDVALGPLQSLA